MVEAKRLARIRVMLLVGMAIVGIAASGFVFAAWSTHELSVADYLKGAIGLAASTAFLVIMADLIMKRYVGWENRFVEAGESFAEGAVDARVMSQRIYAQRMGLEPHKAHVRSSLVLFLVAIVLFLDAGEHEGPSATEVLQAIHVNYHQPVGRLLQVSPTPSPTRSPTPSVTPSPTPAFQGFSDGAFLDGAIAGFTDLHPCRDLSAELVEETVALAAIGIAGLLLSGATVAGVAEWLARGTLLRISCLARMKPLSSAVMSTLQSLASVVGLALAGSAVAILLDTDRLPGSHMGWQAGAGGLAALTGALWLVLALRLPNYEDIVSGGFVGALKSAMASSAGQVRVTTDSGSAGGDPKETDGLTDTDKAVFLNTEHMAEHAETLQASRSLFLGSLVLLGMTLSNAYGVTKPWNPVAILLPVFAGMLGAHVGMHVLVLCMARIGMCRKIAPRETALGDLSSVGAVPSPKDVSALGMLGAWAVLLQIGASAMGLVAVLSSLLGWIDVQHRDYYWVPATMGGVAFLVFLVVIMRAAATHTPATGDAKINDAARFTVLTRVAGTSLGIVVAIALVFVAFETAHGLDTSDVLHASRKHAAEVQGSLLLLLAALYGPYNLFSDAKKLALSNKASEEESANVEVA